MSRRSSERNRPEDAGSTYAGDNDGVVFENLDIVFGKNCDAAVVVAELSERHET